MAQFIEVHRKDINKTTLVSVNIEHIVSFENNAIVIFSYNGTDNLRAIYLVTETYQQIKNLIEGKSEEENQTIN